MTLDFQTWMQAVWSSIMEPSQAARRVIGFAAPRDALWTALALVAVLNVILMMLLQMITPVPDGMQAGAIVISPIGGVAMIGIFLVLFVMALYQVGQFFGGTGSFDGTLAILVWFQAMSLTLEFMQVLLVLISPAIGSLFGIISLAAMIWVFVNFINVLHAYDNFGTSILTIILALLGTALVAAIVIAILGLTPEGLTA